MKNIISALVTVISMIIINSSTYTIAETEQAIILQFGRVMGKPIVKSGLHFKVPFIQEVRRFDKRILQWDGNRGEVPTRDKKYIWVDTTARWKISDCLKFYKTMRDIPNARSRISTILDGVSKDTVSNFNLIEVVRNSNNILKDIENNKAEAERRRAYDQADTSLDELVTSVEKIRTGREKISSLITKRAHDELENFGIELIDVQLRSIAYKEKVEERVYERMISERQKIATKVRSNGKGEREKILGQLELKLKRN